MENERVTESATVIRNIDSELASRGKAMASNNNKRPKSYQSMFTPGAQKILPSSTGEHTPVAHDGPEPVPGQKYLRKPKCKLNWAQITKLNPTDINNTVSFQPQVKIIKTRQILIHQKFNSVAEPTPVAIYLRNVRRGPLGFILNALREFLPSWVLLGLDFIEVYVMEIIADERLRDRTASTLKAFGITEFDNFDSLAVMPSKSRQGESPEGQIKRQVKSVA